MKFGKLLRNYFTCDQDNEKFHQGQGEKPEVGMSNVRGQAASICWHKRIFCKASSTSNFGPGTSDHIIAKKYLAQAREDAYIKLLFQENYAAKFFQICNFRAKSRLCAGYVQSHRAAL